MRRLFISLLFVGCWLISSGPVASADDASLRRQLDRITAALKERCDSDRQSPDSCDDFPPDLPESDARATMLLGRMWSLLEQRSLQFLEESPSPNPNDFARVIGQIGNFDADATNLGPNSLLARINYRNWLGDVFIASKKNRHADIVWRLRDLPISDLQNFPDLMLWAPWDVRSKACRKLNDNSLCQPFAPIGIRRLPDSANGGHRFYVEAIRLQETSCFLLEQVSIWEWRGQHVSPLLAKSYPIDCDGTPIQVDGNIIHVKIKGDFRAMWNSGAGPGREMDWKIAAEPNGIKDLGETPEAPDIDLIDDTLNRVAHDIDASELAAPSVIDFLKQNLVTPGKEPIIGYDGYRSAITAAGTVYCLPLDVGSGSDAYAATYAFTVTKKGQTNFLAQVRELDDPDASGACGR